MMLLKRIYDDLNHFLKPGKVLIIYGARQVGKTTLLNGFLEKTHFKYKIDTGENLRLQNLLGSRDIQRIQDYIGDYELIALDEAQWVPEIGLVLKVMVDHNPKIRFIATGSSSFRLAQDIGEPLTGRKRTLILFPMSQKELRMHFNRYELVERLPEFLVFGCYPEVVVADTNQEKIRILNELVDSYLLRDILVLDRIKSSNILLQLLRHLAFQVGSEVSLNELAKKIRMDVKTVDRYLDLLEKGFIIKRLGGFSRNLRKELTSKAKYYFIDNGIRNAIISQFNDLTNRNDVGVLFENFIIMELIKKNAYEEFYGSVYFWRTYDQQEIDWVEEIEGRLTGYEIKWSERKKRKSPKDWLTSYPKARLETINRQNYLDIIL